MSNVPSRPPRRLTMAGAPLIGCLVVAACSTGGSGPTVAPPSDPPPTAAPGTGAPPSPPSTPAPSPEPTAQVGEIPHPTDPAAIVLSMESCCGFVPVEWSLTEAPTFILYGDNRIVFRPSPDPEQQFGPGAARPSFVEAHMNSEQVDALLRFALGPGGLLDARESYTDMTVSDASTTIFTIDAGGVTKSVNAYALGMDVPGPDAEILGRLAALADLLDSFEEQVAAGQVVSAAPYEPEGYRAWLTEGFGDGPVAEWPWEDLDADDFEAPGDSFARLAGLTPEQVAVVADEPSGGVMGMLLEDEDGAVWSLSIRPLLPGEELLPPTPEEPPG